MARFISAKQYKLLTKIPRGRLAVRTQIYCGVVVERQGKILMIKEAHEKYAAGYDFPGGKLLWNEGVFNCAVREVLEESRYQIKLERLLGIYQRRVEEDEEDYFRFIFIGSLKSNYQRSTGDENVTDITWVDPEQIIKNKIHVRSREIIKEVGDFVSGKSFPLDAVEMYVW